MTFQRILAPLALSVATISGCAPRASINEVVLNPDGSYSATFAANSTLADGIAPKTIKVGDEVYRRAEGDNLREQLAVIAGWKIPEGHVIQAFGGVYWKQAASPSDQPKSPESQK